jgi:hypothetical protein
MASHPDHFLRLVQDGNSAALIPVKSGAAASGDAGRSAPVRNKESFR